MSLHMRTALPPRPAFRLRSSFALASLLLLAFAGLARCAGGVLVGDRLSISVYNHPELSLSVDVAQDGAIRLPLAGRIEAAGKTPERLAEELGDSMQKAGIPDAFVTVVVSRYAPRLAYLLGDVGGGGRSFPIPPTGGLTALQAICAAGGFPRGTDLHRVAVLRTNGAGTERLEVDAIGFVNAAAGARDVLLQPDDVVVVPHARPITVLGLVRSPGTFDVDTSKPLLCSQAIGLAGGLGDGALSTAVTILRQTAEGKPERISVNLEAALDGDFEQDVAILPGDMIVVKAVDRIYVCGQVKSPGAIDPKSDRRLTLMRAITLCGGFTDIANPRRVALVRGDKTTDVDLRNVLLDNDKTANDLPLQPGDMVFVRESIW